MTVDARPSVTVAGTLSDDYKGAMWSIEFETSNAEELAGLRGGDEVEVTIRKHERATGSLFPAPDEADE